MNVYLNCITCTSKTPQKIHSIQFNLRNAQTSCIKKTSRINEIKLNNIARYL